MQKRTFRVAFKEYLESKHFQIDAMSDVDRSKQMAKFYVEEVLQTLDPSIVPEDEEDFDAAVIDGSGDCGIDFLFKKDRHVLVLQCKYRSMGKEENPADFSNFIDLFKRIHPSSGGKFRKNEKLLSAIADIDWEVDSFRLEFISLGKSTAQIEASEQSTSFSHESIPGLNDRVELSFLDESKLTERLRESESARDIIKSPVDVKFSATKGEAPWLTYKSPDARVAYIGRINAAQLRVLYDKYKNRLFTLNIRNYIGDNATNRGIRETATSTPTDFFFYNNGLSAVASEIEPDLSTGTLTCSDFAIVNGAQSVRSLAKAHKLSKAAAEKAEILIRVIQFSSKQYDFLDNVTKYNNTQNAIKLSDFRSNDQVQKDLNTYFNNITRKGKKYYYQNKRTAERGSDKISIKMEEFAKTIHSFQFEPIDYHGGTEYLFSLEPEKGYAKIFGNGTEVWDSIDKEEFDRLAGIWFLCDFSRSQSKDEITRIDSKLSNPIAKNALERRWMIYFTLKLITTARLESDQQKLIKFLKQLSKPSWMDHDGELRQKVQKLVSTSCDILTKVYLAASRDKKFIHRNWFRDIATLEAIREEIALSSTTIEALPRLVD